MISDYGDVPALQTAYHTAADFPTAIAQAVNAGVDVSMTPFDYVGWNNGLIQDVQHGLVSQQRVDQSVKRILTLKFELGLFDHPYVDPAAADAAVTANRDLAKKAADESITLLRNQGNALPLSKSAKLVVTGPSADSVTRQLGGWSVSWQGVFDPSNHVCCMGPPDQIPPATTVLKGIQARRPECRLRAGSGRRPSRRWPRRTRLSWSSARVRTPRGSATIRRPCSRPTSRR